MTLRRLLRGARSARRRRPRVICTLAIGPHLELLDISEPVLRAYAARHGYDVVVARESRCPERPVSWSKVRLIQELMARYELVVWVDVDTVVLDPSRDIADELVPEADIYLAAHHYLGQEIPNAGVLMVRATPAANAFLDLVWEQEQYIEHPWWENAAILDLLGYRLEPCGPERASPHRALFRFIGNEWNSIEEDPSPRPVIRHFAGRSQEVRLAGMEAAVRSLARIVQQAPGTTLRA